MDLRSEVMCFASFMELVLKHNDKKGGWDSVSFHDLFMRLLEEADELREQIDKGDRSFTMKEAIDVGNFAMMIFDKALHEIWRH